MTSSLILRLVQTLVLAVTVSLDGFIAGMAYGTSGISVTLPSYLAVGFLGGAMTGAVLVMGLPLSAFLRRTGAGPIISGILLVGLGCVSALRALETRRGEASPKKDGAASKELLLRWRIRALRLVLEVAREPLSADVDGSGELDISESVALGVALGMDAAVLGLASSFVVGAYLLVPAIAAISPAFLYLGVLAGRKGASTERADTWWARVLPGAALVLIGLVRALRA